jgi:hypothetical protein
MYATAPIFVKGSVVSFERTNPHTLLTLEDRGEDGRVRRWAVEGPPPRALERTGSDRYIPNVGDVVEFCAFPYKPVEELQRLFPGADFSNRRALAAADGASPRYVAGHVMLTADGQKRMWEPHGVLAECIRGSSEQRQVWVTFLNASAAARDALCSQRSYAVVQSIPALQELVAELDDAIDNPCQ